METATSSETSETRTKLSVQRGNFYYGLGFTLLAGLLVVVGLGVLGITSFDVFSVSTAMAMIALAITLLSVVSFVTLVTMRRTIEILSEHETTMAEQAERHADLAAKVQSQWHAEQVIRDRNQDADLAALSARQDATFAEAQARTERNRLARGARRTVGPPVNPFEGGQVHPVRDIEGVGEHYGKLLDDLGLKDTEQLWNADATYVAGALRITPPVVESWQCMAELMAVSGIGKQYAELLVRADVSTIYELADETAQPLLNRIHRLENRLEKQHGGRVQGNTIGLKIVESWITSAQSHRGYGPTVGGAGPTPEDATPVVTVVGSNGPGA